MMPVDPSLQLTAPPAALSRSDRVGLTLIGIAVLLFVVAGAGAGALGGSALLVASTVSLLAGCLIFFLRYARRPAGIQNDRVAVHPVTAGGAAGWMLGVLFTGFYVILYWFPVGLEGLVRMFDPLSELMRGRAADQWFLYGFFYTFAVVVMGVRAIVKYRHIKYQIVRTISVVFFQLVLAFIIPQVMQWFNEPELYFSYFWPLDYDLLWPSKMSELWASPGRLGMFMLVWGAMLTFLATPVLTYRFGKRWYCSWVCGCGGLAETLGDPFRHLSNKSLSAWRVERWMIHSVLVFVVVTTALLWTDRAMGGGLLGEASMWLARAYGFAIGSVFAGVIGVGFYPLMGSRVWCRFGCPMAAILGLLQKFFSRFRITTNGAQCISCGNCSKYCEMGIDVRWYAQRGQNIVRASCVGCGICSAVCPRGVLKLENGPRTGRYNGPVLIDRDAVSVLPGE